MNEQYGGHAARSIGSCQSCRTNSELRFFKGRNLCDECIKQTQSQNTAQGQVQSNEPDRFEATPGDYICIAGKRYEIVKAKKGRCKHKVLDWLNEGPVQYSFCPQCGSQVHYERTTVSEEGNEVSQPTRGGGDDSVPESTRTPNAKEGVAGLHGSDDGNSVGDRAETSERAGESDEAATALALEIIKSGEQNPSRKKRKRSK